MSTAVPTDFVHLHNHSDFSLLDGAMKTKQMAKLSTQSHKAPGSPPFEVILSCKSSYLQIDTPPRLPGAVQAGVLGVFP